MKKMCYNKYVNRKPTVATSRKARWFRWFRISNNFIFPTLTRDRMEKEWISHCFKNKEKETMVRKILAIFMSMLMLMMSMAVYANETEHVHKGCCCKEVVTFESSSVLPRKAEACQSCEGGYIYRKTRNTVKYVEADCYHLGYRSGYDIYKDTYTYEYYQCNRCYVTS